MGFRCLFSRKEQQGTITRQKESPVNEDIAAELYSSSCHERMTCRRLFLVSSSCFGSQSICSFCASCAVEI